MEMRPSPDHLQIELRALFAEIADVARFCVNNDISANFLVKFIDKTRYTDWQHASEWVTVEDATIEGRIAHIEEDGYRKRILGTSCYIPKDEIAVFVLRFKGILNYSVVDDE